jgi:hypothetical protein
MDGQEMRALATVCGANIDGLPEGSGRAPAFAAHLVDVIARYEFNAFFLRDPSQSINGIDVRPRGVDYRTSQVDAPAMAEWRRRYKARCRLIPTPASSASSRSTLAVLSFGARGAGRAIGGRRSYLI